MTVTLTPVTTVSLDKLVPTASLHPSSTLYPSSRAGLVSPATVNIAISGASTGTLTLTGV